MTAAKKTPYTKPAVRERLKKKITAGTKGGGPGSGAPARRSC